MSPTEDPSNDKKNLANDTTDFRSKAHGPFVGVGQNADQIVLKATKDFRSKPNC